MYVHMAVWMFVWKHRWMDRWVDAWMNGYMDGGSLEIISHVMKSKSHDAPYES